MCNQSTWSNLWNCICGTYLTIKNHQRKFYKILTSWRILDTKTKLDDKKQCFYIPVKFLVTYEYKKPKRWHANIYMISQKNYNHFFATKPMRKAEKIKKITYPRKGMCVCKHLFITCPAVFSKMEYTLWLLFWVVMTERAVLQIWRGGRVRWWCWETFSVRASYSFGHSKARAYCCMDIFSLAYRISCLCPFLWEMVYINWNAVSKDC